MTVSQKCNVECQTHTGYIRKTGLLKGAVATPPSTRWQSRLPSCRSMAVPALTWPTHSRPHGIAVQAHSFRLPQGCHDVHIRGKRSRWWAHLPRIWSGMHEMNTKLKVSNVSVTTSLITVVISELDDCAGAMYAHPEK